MSISVQELDNTVRALFEGKGEIVGPAVCHLDDLYILGVSQAPSWVERLTRLCTHLAKPSPTDFDRSKRACRFELDINFELTHFVVVQFKQNPDAWVTVGNILQEASYLQTKCVSQTPLTTCHSTSPANSLR